MTRVAGKLVDPSTLDGVDVRPVPSALDHFATADGRILSMARAGRLRERRPAAGNRGYLTLVVTRGRTSVGCPVHRMVAEAFHGPKPFAGAQVRHLNGNRTDNRADNLMWGTAQENIDDRERHGTTARGARNGAYTKPHRVRRGEQNGRALLDAAAVDEIKRRLAAGERKADIARAFNVSWSCVDHIARGDNWNNTRDGR